MERRLQALVFDLGGTLVSHRSDTTEYASLKAQTLRSVYLYLQETKGLATDFNSFSDIYDVTAHRLLLKAIQHNEPMSEMDTLRSIVEEHGLTISDKECHAIALLISRAQSSLSAPYDEVADTLAQLHSLGIPMGLISNTPWIPEAHDEELYRHSFSQYFRFRLYSSGERTWKPHRPIFQKAINLLNLPANEIAYVGDRVIDDVQGAQNAGMTGILIDRSNSFVTENHDVSPDWTFTDLRPLTNLPFTST